MPSLMEYICSIKTIVLGESAYCHSLSFFKKMVTREHINKKGKKYT